MSVEFQEYKGKRKRITPRQHKFPLLRLLIVALAAFFVYWSGLPSKIANALPLPGNEKSQDRENWESRCAIAGGTAFTLSDSLAQCSWALTDSLQDSLLLPNPFLRYVASLRETRFAKLHWVSTVSDFSDPLFVLFEGARQENFLHMMKPDSNYVWIRQGALLQESDKVFVDDGCRFPGVCPHLPLEWSALPIAEGFDFEGQESLIAADVFRGVGEAPVHPILSGRVLETGKDSLGYFVEIDHGNNIVSLTSGLGLLNDSLSVGDSVNADIPVGKLAPLDSSAFFLKIRENGKFIRWKDFYAEAYPISKEEIKNFIARIQKFL